MEDTNQILPYFALLHTFIQVFPPMLLHSTKKLDQTEFNMPTKSKFTTNSVSSKLHFTPWHGGKSLNGQIPCLNKRCTQSPQTRCFQDE